MDDVAMPIVAAGPIDLRVATCTTAQLVAEATARYGCSVNVSPNKTEAIFTMAGSGVEESTKMFPENVCVDEVGLKHWQVVGPEAQRQSQCGQVMTSGLAARQHVFIRSCIPASVGCRMARAGVETRALHQTGAKSTLRRC